MGTEYPKLVYLDEPFVVGHYKTVYNRAEEDKLLAELHKKTEGTSGYTEDEPFPPMDAEPEKVKSEPFPPIDLIKAAPPSAKLMALLSKTTDESIVSTLAGNTANKKQWPRHKGR